MGAAKTGQSTGGPGETVKDVENATADNENAGSGEQEKVSGGDNTGTTDQTPTNGPLQVNYSVYFRNRGWSDRRQIIMCWQRRLIHGSHP